jgi:broad specificity phosphatase PhoE
VRGVNRALARPAPVLVVAHGALFRALRLALGHEPNVRTPNALPMHVTPPPDGGAVWGIAPAVLAEG